MMLWFMRPNRALLHPFAYRVTETHWNISKLKGYIPAVKALVTPEELFQQLLADRNARNAPVQFLRAYRTSTNFFDAVTSPNCAFTKKDPAGKLFRGYS